MPPSPAPPGPIDLAFPDRPDIPKRTYAAIAQSPSLTGLFTDIAAYIHSLRDPSSRNPSTGDGADDDGRTTKKRKLDQSSHASNNGNGTTILAQRNGADNDIRADWDKGTYHSVKDISFSVPQRKKFVLEVGRRRKGQGIRARNASTGRVEFGILWGDIRMLFSLVPQFSSLHVRTYLFISAPTCLYYAV